MGAGLCEPICPLKVQCKRLAETHLVIGAHHHMPPQATTLGLHQVICLLLHQRRCIDIICLLFLKLGQLDLQVASTCFILVLIALFWSVSEI